MHLEKSNTLPKLLSQGLVLDIVEVELGIGYQSIILLRKEFKVGRLA